MRAAAASVAVLLVCAIGVQARQAPAPDLSAALKAALRQALPFPDARADGTPSAGGAEVAWTVRWPQPGESRLQVVANPLHPGNRERALKAEEEIQKAAMQSQRRSQDDYEKAVADFTRTGRVGEIREVSLDDAGLAGETYDAESQLTIEIVAPSDRVTVSTSRLPESLPGSNGATAVVRLAANTYRDAGTAGEPAAVHFCPEQAWVFVGPVARPEVSRVDDAHADVVVPRAGSAPQQPVVIWISGNVELVDRVLQQADWAVLARAGG